MAPLRHGSARGGTVGPVPCPCPGPPPTRRRVSAAPRCSDARSGTAAGPAPAPLQHLASAARGVSELADRCRTPTGRPLRRNRRPPAADADEIRGSGGQVPEHIRQTGAAREPVRPPDQVFNLAVQRLTAGRLATAWRDDPADARASPLARNCALQRSRRWTLDRSSALSPPESARRPSNDRSSALTTEASLPTPPYTPRPARPVCYAHGPHR